MKPLAALAVALACCLAVANASGPARAQTVPAAPTIATVTAGTNSLTVSWNAPASDGGSAVEAYDLRYIESAAADKADEFWSLKEPVWSSGALSYTISGLADGVGFDVQLRAVNTIGHGEWSDPPTAASTNDHGGTPSTATTLALDSSLPGRIDPGDDVDHFTIVLGERTDLWLYTTGELDTSGALTDAASKSLEANNDGRLPPNPRNFSLRAELDPGTYYVTVRSENGDDAGDYVLHAVKALAVGNAAPKTVELGSLTPARLVLPGWIDWFKIVLTEPTDLWVMSIGATDTVGGLYDADDNPLGITDDGAVPGNHLGFNLRAQLGAGTYYVRVNGYGFQSARGPYILYTAAADDPGNSTAGATPLRFDLPAAGRIEPAGDQDYFSFSPPTLADVTLCALAFDRERFPLNMALFDADGNAVRISVTRGKGCGLHSLGPSSAVSTVRLAAGAYYLRVTMSGDQTEAYTLVALLDQGPHEFEQDCLRRGSSQSDPLYGCQWHLNNTGQYGSGARQDINVEEVWATNKGEGVNVAVVDDGLDLDHEDLAENISREASQDYTPDQPWDTETDWHGTQVAGLIAARDNFVGVRGIAPRATLYGYRVLAGTDADVLDALVHRMAEVAVSNHSYGFEDNGQYHYAGTLWEMAVERGVREGYGGKGVFYVWAAGNGSAFSDNANYDSNANHYAVTAACAVDYKDERAAYSELGANLWVCAPSSPGGFSFLPEITTTANLDRYTKYFGGTSATAPIVSGVAALLRSAHPGLTWRELKLILAGSARHNDPGHTQWEEGALKYGSAEERYSFNHAYGFGVVDAGAAMALADDWTSPPAWRELSANSNEQIVFDSGETGSSSIRLDPYVDFIEFVALDLEVSHPYYPHLRIKLTSPSGATSIITFPLITGGRIERGHIEPWVNAMPRFGSAKHLGENAAGEWTLSIVNEGVVGPATLHSWKLTAYGHGYTPGFAELLASQARDRAILVVWRGPGGTDGTVVSSYDLRYRRSDAAGQAEGDEWTERTGVWSSGSLSYQLEGLAAGGRYELQLRAVSEAGPGPWSERLEAATEAVAPEAPAISQVEPGNGALKLSWTAPAHDGGAAISSYDLRSIRSDATDKADDKWTEVIGAWTFGDLADTIAGLTNGVAYDVQVRAVNQVRAGDWSATSTGTPRTVPGAPAVETVSGGRRSLTVEWSAPAHGVGAAVSSYAMQYIRSDAADKSADRWSPAPVAWTLGDPLRATITGLEDGAGYDVQVRAVNTVGAGLWSASVTGMTLPSEDATLSGLQLSGVRLAPAFASETTEYAGAVGYTVRRVTVEAARSDGDATVAYLDGNDMSLSDADADSANGFQADLAVGENVIRVRVTAGDGTTTRTYGVTVTRTEADPSLTPAASDPSAPFASAASYRIAFRGRWTDEVTPGGLPAGAHFSRLIGGVHNAGVSFLESGGRASPGVESMAETGGTSTLRGEVNTASNADPPTALSVLEGSTGSISPTATRTLSNRMLTTEFPRVTLTTMIAPSHDWFVGVSGLPLLNASGLWLRSPGVDLFPWDAGTEEGDDFSLQPSVATTRGVITSIRGTGTFTTERIAGLTFTLQSVETTRSLVENTAGVVELGPPVAPAASSGAVGYTLGGADAGSFDLDEATGQLSTKAGATFNHEAKDSHTVTVTATDADGPVVTTVHIHVTDLDEPPAIAGPEARDHRENATTSVATYRATDPEEAPVEWSLSGDDQSHFSISSGVLSFDQPPDYDARADSDGNNDYEVTVEASDGSLSGRLDVTVTVSDVNEPPEITPADDIAVDENYDGTLAAFSALDPENEPGLTYTWSLAGADAGDFNLGEDGVLAFKNIPDADNPADSGRDNVYDITVRAEDSAGMRGSIDLAVTVRPVNEPPTISGAAAPSIKEEGSLVVGTYRVTDPEGGTIAWQPLDGSDGDKFEFTSSNGRLAFKAAPDFESPTDAGDAGDAGLNNVYKVRLSVSDGSNLETHDVTVTVTNEEEPGTLGLSSEQPLVGTVLTATLADPDGGVRSESWSWERSLNLPTWTEISGATGRRYTPLDDDLNHYLRVTVDYTDGHGPDKSIQKTADDRVEEPPPVNFPPEFPDATAERSVAENSTEGTPAGAPVKATDANDDRLSYTLGAAPFTIDGGGQIRVAQGAALDYEGTTLYVVTVTARDPSDALAIIFVSITVTDVNEAPEAVDDTVTTDEDVVATIDVLANDDDPDEDDPNNTLTVSVRTPPANGSATVETDNRIAYTPNPDYHGADSFTYTASDGSLTSGQATVAVTIDPVNDAPQFAAAAAERSVSVNARAEDPVGAPVTATDVDENDTLTYSRSGTDAFSFEIDRTGGQITVGAGTTFDIATRDTYELTVTAEDGNGGRATVAVTITVTARPAPSPGPGPGPTGGGGGPSGPSPSELDFEWTVKHDIEALAAANAAATGVWSDGETLWVANNPDGAGDGVYAYDLETGERVEEREFELDDANRAPRGVWSDGTVIWVSDSGRDKLFAHDLASGERLPDSDLALHPDNDDPRGIWSDGETMWVLDGGRRDALFAYDLQSGQLLAECALDSANGDPRGLWSDGVTIWVSDHGTKRLFAYRLPLLPEEAGDSDVEDADADGKELERVRDEEFRELSKASNNSPRGIWSDGDVMYVADASDDRVYSYNMPDAIDARLASLSLSGVDIGEFSPRTTEYTGVAGEGVTETTVEAEAMQRRTTVVIDPPDADGAGENGHQVALEGPAEITVTVTSADGSRERVYQVVLGGPDTERAPWAHCLSGDIAVGFSLVLYEGGGVDDLVACAESRSVAALYALEGGVYASHILGAPEFVNRSFGELFLDGLPSFTPLVARSDGPPSADPAGDIPPGDGAPQFGPNCLLGHIAVGFSLVLHEGGSVEDLVACAQSRHVTALYALHEGAYVSYILGAPEFVNRPFVELFADGLPPVTPLVARSEKAAGN